jgi:(2R)-sulfolactate sulfo-lyase subunit alpha
VSPQTPDAPAFLMHRDGDSVAVATSDLSPGPVIGAVIVTGARRQLSVSEPVPLGHKFAVANVANGDPIIEYGVAIGVATRDVLAGQHVHVHNLRSSRWPVSRLS